MTQEISIITENTDHKHLNREKNTNVCANVDVYKTIKQRMFTN